MTVKNLVLLLGVLASLPCLAQVAVNVATNKAEYLVGEPILVTVAVKNIGTEPLGYSYCDGNMELTVENGTKKEHPNLFSCFVGNGIGPGFGCGIDHPPLMHPNETRSFQYLLKGYKLTAGKYVLHAKGRAAVRWSFGNGVAVFSPVATPTPLQHHPGDPVEGAAFDLSFSIPIRDGSQTELEKAYQPYVADLGSFERRRQAQEAIAEMAPEFLEKTILAFSKDTQSQDLAVNGLGQIPTAESRTDLVALFDQSTDMNLRTKVVEALAYIATKDQIDFFSSLLPGRSTKADDEIRKWAALGLGRIGGDEAATALMRTTLMRTTLMRTTARNNPNPEVRATIATALGNTRSRLAVPALINMYDPKDGQTSSAVCDGLTTLTHYSFCNDDVSNAKKAQARWLGWWHARDTRTPLYANTQCVDLSKLKTVP